MKSLYIAPQSIATLAHHFSESHYLCLPDGRALLSCTFAKAEHQDRFEDIDGVDALPVGPITADHVKALESFGAKAGMTTRELRKHIRKNYHGGI
jgi:hypothetical protein